MSEAAEKPKWGFTDEELGRYESVFRPNLMKDAAVLVTGGGSGMGRVMAFLFAKLGARVMICGRKEEKLRAVADAILAQTGASVAIRAMNIRDPAQVEALFDDIHARFGCLHTLVNNAGGQYPQDAIDYSVKGWNAVIDTNLNGTFWMMQQAARRWRDAKAPGNIVTIVAYVERGLPQIAHTCAARAGVIYLSKTLAVEWAPLNIRLNCIAPGSIATEGLDVYPPEASARFKDANPMRHIGDAFDIAEGVVYLSAGSGKFITGEMLTIDGGYQMWGNVWPGGVPDYFNVV